MKIWNDERFRTLSDDGKLVFLFILTHPAVAALGAMRASASGLAAELGWPLRRFRSALFESVDRGMVAIDEGASFIGLPNFLKYNEPTSPNAVQGWVEALNLIPECGARRELVARCRTYLEGRSNAFRRAIVDANGDAVRDAFGLASDIQEMEPKKEGEKNPSDAKTLAASDAGFETFWSAYPRRDGDNPKRRAKRAFDARLRGDPRKGIPPATCDEIIEGARRYADWVRERGREGTEFVKQAATFLGPDCPFREPWSTNGSTEDLPGFTLDDEALR